MSGRRITDVWQAELSLFGADVLTAICQRHGGHVMRTSYKWREAAEIVRLCARAGSSIVVIVILGSSVSAAVAQGPVVPKYDVKSYCKEIAGFGGTFSEMVMESCLGMEQSSYNKLKARWGKIAQPIRTHCDDIARKAYAFASGEINIW